MMMWSSSRSVGPVPEKGFDILADACSAAGVRFELITGGVAEDDLAQRYVDADVFALLSRHEPWGVVVNEEAAASGLPLVLSDQVGAAADLLRAGENGFLVPDETSTLRPPYCGSWLETRNFGREWARARGSSCATGAISRRSPTSWLPFARPLRGRSPPGDPRCGPRTCGAPR